MVCLIYMICKLKSVLFYLRITTDSYYFIRHYGVKEFGKSTMFFGYEKLLRVLGCSVLHVTEPFE